MPSISRASRYFNHPKVMAFFSSTASVGGIIQDLFVNYVDFGQYLAGIALLCFVLILVLSLLKRDGWLRNRFGEDWPGIGLTATGLFAVIMLGFFYLSQNNKPQGGALAAAFPQVAHLQKGMDAMMQTLGVVKAQTSAIKKNTSVIRQTTARIQKTLDNDPETQLKQQGLTLSSQGYIELLSRPPNSNTTKLLSLFKKYGFDLNLQISNTRFATSFWGQFSDPNLSGYQSMSQWGLLQGLVLLGNGSLPGLPDALAWELKHGRDINQETTFKFNTWKALGGHCGSNISCFATHLLRFRQGHHFFSDKLALVHIAALSGNVGDFPLLKADGANLNLVTKVGYTPLALAEESDNRAAILWLLKQGAGHVDDRGATYEVTAFKAFDGFDQQMDRMAWIDASQPYSWDRTFKKQIHDSQALLGRLSADGQKQAIAGRVRAAVEPYLKKCRNQVNQERQTMRQQQARQSHKVQKAQYGHGSVAEVDQEIKGLKVALQSNERAAEQTQMQWQKAKAKLAKIESKKSAAQSAFDKVHKSREATNAISQYDRYMRLFELEGKKRHVLETAKQKWQRVHEQEQQLASYLEGYKKNEQQSRAKIQKLKRVRQQLAATEAKRPAVALPTNYQHLGAVCGLADQFLASLKQP